MQDAIASGAIKMGPYGTAPLLAAWEKAKDTPAANPCRIRHHHHAADARQQPSPMSRPSPISSRPTASPCRRSPRRRCTCWRCNRKRLSRRTINCTIRWSQCRRPKPIAALVDGSGVVTAYFASPPFTQLALRDAKVHRVLSSVDVMNGKASFLIMGATRAYIERIRQCRRRSARRWTSAGASHPQRSASRRANLPDPRAVDVAERPPHQGAAPSRDKGPARQPGLRRAGFCPFPGPARRSSKRNRKAGRTSPRRRY